MSSLVVEARPRAVEVSVTDDELRVVLADGRALSVPLAWFPRLLHATSAQRQRFELLGDGEGIHWPDVDEDLSVAGLLPVRRRLSGVSDLMADGALRHPCQQRKLYLTLGTSPRCAEDCHLDVAGALPTSSGGSCAGIAGGFV